MIKKLRLVFLSLIFVQMLFISGTVFAVDKNQDLLQQIIARGELKVGTAVGYPPFEMTDAKNNYIGFDIDIARFVARNLGVELKVTNVDWQGIIPGLVIGQYDMLISGMTATLERAKKIQFATPYIQVGQKLLINKKRLPKVTSYKELVTKENLIISTGLSNTGHFLAMNLFPKAQFRPTSDVEAAQDVIFGKADIGIFDGPFAQKYLNTYGTKVYSTNDLLSAEPLAIGVRQGVETLMFMNWLNTCMYHLNEITIVNKELMEEFDLDKSFMGKKFYDALYHKWFVVWLKGDE